MFHRREFIFSGAAALAGGVPLAGDPFHRFFSQILRGFLKNARATSSSYAVCDFPGGTKLKSCVAKSGKTYVSVARMMPALASCYAGGVRIPGVDIEAILLAAFKNAFNPEHPDYWEEPPPNRTNQRQVEASLVAWSLWRAGDRFLKKLTPDDRKNIQRWLASCTRVVERQHNHAWFSALNQAVRLSLQERWPEFQGDEAWMLEDLRSLDSMGSPGDGWYQDSLTQPIFDYYNFWTFASHFLAWNQIAGGRYARQAAPFLERLRLFLAKTPYFFSANGSTPLYGRSLIYRWAVLTPLVQAYEQGLWPYSPGLLRRIVRLNLDFHERIGSFDPQAGKLRETYSAEGCPEVREFYIDNGHPYWCMQAYSFLALPRRDAFWTALEDLLPVEKEDFTVRFEGPRMLLYGTRSSGQVRWAQAQGVMRHVRYRDKYVKLSYSSHFPFNVLAREDRCPWDSALVFRDPASGYASTRTTIVEGKLMADGVRIEWTCEFQKRAIRGVTEVRLEGEFEFRRHNVLGAGGLEILEGSAALGLAAGESFERMEAGGGSVLRSSPSGYSVASWNYGGFERITQDTSFDESGRENVNVIHSRSVVNTLRVRAADQSMTLMSLHYASPKPLDKAGLARRAAELRKRFL